MPRSRVLSTLGPVALLVPLAAQQAAPPQKANVPHQLPGITSSLRDNVGLHEVDGELRGGGDAYKATFTRERIEFTPALPTAPRNFPLALQTKDFGRGAQRQPITAVAPQHELRTVRYARPEFLETYELRKEGLKQSFTFTTLPAGDGDLVVRCGVQTDLQPHWDGVQLELLLPGVGGISIRDVVGIDANGHRFGGTMRWDAGTLEFALPAHEVGKAALPLVLDPLIGGAINVQVGTVDDFEPDVAYDTTNDVYLVTFRRAFSASDHDVHGQMVNGDGTLRGGRLLIENSTAFEWHGRVASVNLEDCFVVVYTRQDNVGGDDVVGRAVRASDSAIGNATFLAPSSNFLFYPDVGGEATLDDNDAVCVFYDGSADELRANQVAVFGSANPPVLSAGSAVLLSGLQNTSWSEGEPAIAKSGGRTGRYLVTWGRQFSSFAGTELRGVVIDRNVVILTSFLAITNNQNNVDSDAPECDGDGENWVVAWQGENSPASGDDNIYAQAISNGPFGAFLRGGRVDVETGTGDNEYDPSVSWLGGSVLVGYTDNFSGSDNDLVVKNIDPFTCASCEGYAGVDASFDDDNTLVMASAFSGGRFASGGALIAYRKRDITGTGNLSDILARRFAAEDGGVSDSGGGCGAGGTLANSCMRVGNGAFTFRLRAAATNSAAFLLLSPRYSGRSCGSCRLIADPWFGTVAVAPSTDGVGDTGVALAIPFDPALAGFGLYAQFAVAGTSCASGFDLSNGIFATIQ